MAKEKRPDLIIKHRVNLQGGTTTEYNISSRWWWLFYFLGMCLMVSGNDSHVDVSVDDKSVEVSE